MRGVGRRGKVEYGTVSIPKPVLKEVDDLIALLGYWPSRSAFVREAVIEKFQREMERLRREAEKAAGRSYGFDLDEMRSHLDGLALELLGDMFPGVDVGAYYRFADEYVEGYMERDPKYRRFAEGGGPVERLVYTSMEKVASAYTFAACAREVENGVLG